MGKQYYFGIKDQKVGPWDENGIREKMGQGLINGSTLAWCQGMSEWKSVEDVPDLSTLLNNVKAGAVPPPLPVEKTASNAATPPPLPPGRDGVPEGLSPLETQAYRFLTWGPKRGPNLIRSYVEKNPRMALPAAALLILCFVLAMVYMANSMSDNQQQIAQQQQMQQPGMPNPNWQAGYQAMRDAQQFSSQVSDDVYKYRRDAEDRMSETYRRGTYDWYNKDDD